MLFDHPKCFEEIYCIALRVLDVTWDEMNASYMDFPRVISAVRKQMGDVFVKNPITLDQFERAATGFGKKQADVHDDDEALPNAPLPVKQLRAHLKQEILGLVKKQRISYLVEGAFFKVYKPKGKQHSYLYLKLSPNLQEFFYAAAPSLDSIPVDAQSIGTLYTVVSVVSNYCE